MSTLLEPVDQAICARGLFRRGQKILVAVSGGVDSMVLLHLLQQLSQKHQWRLAVAHLNHQLRGRSSDADQRLVVQTAKALGLRIVVGRADVRKRAGAGDLSLEMAARQARHEFLARAAARLKIHSIALAHHADDQVELFFLRLLRGSGSEGLAGMKWKNLSPFRLGKTKIELVRPLLALSKASLLEYAAAEKVRFREDATNASRDILRNRLRHELLPLLRQKYQPALDQVILRLMEVTGADALATHQAAQQWLAGKKSIGFEKLPVAIQRRVLQLRLQRKQIVADFGLIERLRTSPGRPVTISPQSTVLRDASGALQFRKVFNAEPNPAQMKLRLNGEAGKTSFAGKKIQWQTGPLRVFHRPQPCPGKEVFDADKVGTQVVLRHWRPGDRFQPIGMAQTVKLQDFFTNQHIPRAKRHKLIVATTAQNEVFWVEGMRIAEPFRLSSTTRRRLVWCWAVV